ncbi:hypothetical protein [Streptomyces sp. HPF1205]|uniref:hypothetical protein n=1 Tax=Streptomyces sp. HPF1205 TaxID=2873262 RepID=UPI001CED188B|nr:hypothetical protein [Streptomyces sp. HPF1205]
MTAALAAAGAGAAQEAALTAAQRAGTGAAAQEAGPTAARPCPARPRDTPLRTGQALV